MPSTLNLSADDRAFEWARDQYASVGVDVEGALATMAGVAVSLPCWQGDDVRGFESGGTDPGGGLAVTGAYPGRARNAAELREDFEAARALIPGRLRMNLHAIYGEFRGSPPPRDALEPAHFEGWMAWAQSLGVALDFNPTFFAHPWAADGWTLAHPSEERRRHWVGHGRRCREIGAVMGRRQGSSCVVNVWVPDGSKEVPADRLGPRERLAASLDAIFAGEFPESALTDAVEPKLFGLGSESYVAGSHDFYAAYAITRRKFLCLDMGHYHPTEDVADKLSALLPSLPGLLLHMSRGVRWDSDHVPVLDDPLKAVLAEVVRTRALGRVRLALDYFDGGINRVAAWVLGGRNVFRALLAALLEPPGILAAERAGDLTARLAAQEDARSLPWGAVWEAWCRRNDVPADGRWLAEVRRHERERQSLR